MIYLNNVKVINKTRFSTFALVLCWVIFASVGYSQDGWIIDKSYKDEQGRSIVELKHSDGSTRKETTTFFSDDPDKEETITIEQIDRFRINSVTFTRMNKKSETTYYKKETFDSNKKISEGIEWHLKELPGFIHLVRGIKIVKEYDPVSEKWEEKNPIYSIYWITEGLDILKTDEWKNERLMVECPPNPNSNYEGYVTGTNKYYFVSRVCNAAFHAGRISFEKGGILTLEFTKEINYVGSTQNGVESQSLPQEYVVKNNKWNSFVFVD
jgi:hypothetical protein